jgi:hypothetical protein
MRASRFFGAVVAASVLSIGFSGVAAADTVSGQVGHFIFTDGNSTTTAGAKCRYTQTDPNTWRIYRIVARAPKVWWPDTSSTSNTQHGRVGWRVILKYRHSGDTAWTVLKKSAIQYATAYEDHPLYDSADKAPFTKIAVDFNGSNFAVGDQFMVTDRVNWYRKDGSVRGYATHDVFYYNQIVSGSSFGVTGVGYCVDAFQVA